MQKSRFSIFGGALCAVLLLSGCDMTTPSQVETGHIRLQEDMKSVTVNPVKADARQVLSIADEYKRVSRGKMSMVIPYQKGSPAEEVKARRQGRDWQQHFAKEGIHTLDVSYVGVEDPRLLSQAVISYPALQAHAPEGCRRLTGVYGADSLEDVHAYRMGCETKSAISKMIVHPEDLLGRGNTEKADSRRAGTVVEGYLSGTPNEPLDGGRASDVGGQ